MLIIFILLISLAVQIIDRSRTMLPVGSDAYKKIAKKGDLAKVYCTVKACSGNNLRGKLVNCRLKSSE